LTELQFPQVPDNVARFHCNPDTVVAVFLDQMGFARWPDPGPDWGPRRPSPTAAGPSKGCGG
jgi:hypothetical protein